MNILILGDSIARGAYDRESGGRANRLKMRGFNRDVFVYNNNVCGANSSHIVDKLDNNYKHSKPNIIIIAIGINDARYDHKTNTQNISLEQFVNNLNHISIFARHHDTKLMMIGLTPVDDTKTAPTRNKKELGWHTKDIQHYDQTIKEHCQEHNIDYLHLYDLFTLDDLDDDGLHPNSAGHKKVFERVKSYLQDIIF